MGLIFEPFKCKNLQYINTLQYRTYLRLDFRVCVRESTCDTGRHIKVPWYVILQVTQEKILFGPHYLNGTMNILLLGTNHCQTHFNLVAELNTNIVKSLH